ncbi:nitronate monooxygenase [Demequina sp.]|uniref:NAD(P)H-dependent flavin oxidoreductase n=1 Tax=Demequina sp. TaxID=2050685 RepID=UPI0025B8DC2B|nr:nitronate monooxygenase [Demequina sp.]
MNTRPGRLEKLLGIDDAIVLGPFGGVSSVSLTAAISECGGLGSYGLYGYQPERIAQTIHDIRTETSRPFAVNLWLPTGDEVTPGDIDLAPYTRALAPLFASAGHRVSFLRAPEDSLVGLLALVPQAVDAVSVPVIAAGGIADRRGVSAAFALGADGVQVGTAFLRTRQSGASDACRRAIGTVGEVGTVLTRATSGRLSRGIANDAVTAIEAAETIAPFPAQIWLTGQFRTEAARVGRSDLLSLWAGQSAPLTSTRDAHEVYQELRAGLGSAAGA